MNFPWPLPLLIAGLPWTAWLLWLASVGLGLAVVVWFNIRHRWPRTRGSDRGE